MQRSDLFWLWFFQQIYLKLASDSFVVYGLTLGYNFFYVDVDVKKSR